MSATVRHIGLPAAGAVYASQQLQKASPGIGRVQPLPPGLPGRATGEQVGIKYEGPLTFIVIGDHGGVLDPNPQKAVATALAQETSAAFVWSVGDLVYFNGNLSAYNSQFYEAYAHVAKPIVGIPGNHDGDPDITQDPANTGITTFMQNFCATVPGAPSVDPELEFGRDVQTQPHCDWTLDLPDLTLIGLWSNVPSGGHFYDEQLGWLADEIRAAPTDRPLGISIHHPPYSADTHHGGSARMGTALDDAIAAAGRWPDIVLSGHVHNYQRFTRVRQGLGQFTRYFVVGNSGYHNLHKIAQGAVPGSFLSGDVRFDAGQDRCWGYLRVTVDQAQITGEFVGVDKDGNIFRGQDKF